MRIDFGSRISYEIFYKVLNLIILYLLYYIQNNLIDNKSAQNGSVGGSKRFQKQPIGSRMTLSLSLNYRIC